MRQIIALLRISDGRCWAEGLGEYRIRFIAGNNCEILHMRTSCCYRSAAGGARKHFSTLLGEKDNEPAVSIETENKFDNIINNHSLKKKKSILQTENLNRF